MVKLAIINPAFAPAREPQERRPLPGLVGRSEALQRVFRLVAKAAASDAAVLITGESGTGKELVARALHEQGPRRRQKLVTLNCAALTDGLFESELFGHERGAFTGALQRKRGLFEEAHGGTIFLDEVAEVPPAAQAKLLRVLQFGELRRVGATENQQVDVRVIAATNKDLRAEVAAGRFREDLYYRLDVVGLDLPPLRERPGDVALLVHHFLERTAARHGAPRKTMSPEALARLEAYPWPGNVRELENAVERAVVLAETEIIGPAALPPAVRRAGAEADPGRVDFTEFYAEAKRTCLERFDAAYGRRRLEQANGNVTEAARAAGMDRSNFRKILQRAGLDPGDFKAVGPESTSRSGAPPPTTPAAD